MLILLIFLVPAVFARNALDGPGGISRYEYERDYIGFLDNNNNWTSINIFTNYTWINYESFNVSGTMNVSEICIGAICVNDWGSVNMTDLAAIVANIGNWSNDKAGVYANDSRLDDKIDSIGNWSANASSYVPYIGASGDVDLELFDLDATNLHLDGYVLSDLLPSPTLTLDLGSGANRWLTLWVANISAEYIETYDMDVLYNLTVGDSLCVGSNCISNWSDIDNSLWSNTTEYLYIKPELPQAINTTKSCLDENCSSYQMIIKTTEGVNVTWY